MIKDKEKQHNYYKARYRKLKEEGLCVRCGGENNSGKVLCPACELNIIEANKRTYQKHKETRKQYSRTYFREKYAERLENGLCVRCGKRPPKKNCTRCEICLEYARKDTHRRTVAKREQEKEGENRNENHI